MSRKKVKYSLSNWDLVSVNPSYKVWTWKDLFSFWAVNIQSVIAFSLIASLYSIDLLYFIIFCWYSIKAAWCSIKPLAIPWSFSVLH